jgi:hypothetical protein
MTDSGIPHPAGPEVPYGGAGVDALTADGGIVTIRPIRRGDRRAVAALYDSASPDSLRLRFFGRPSAAALAAEVERLCQSETDRHLAVLAEECGALVGVASDGFGAVCAPHRY